MPFGQPEADLIAAACAALKAYSTAKMGAAVPVATPAPTKGSMSQLIGVNVHLNYNDNDTYANWNKVHTALQYLGVTHIRTAAPNPTDQGQGAFAQFAAWGYKMLLICGARPVADHVSSIAGLEAAAPGCVAGIEGPNEVNNHSGYGFAPGDHKGGVAYQAALYAAVKATPLLAAKPVWGLTDYPDQANKCDVANFHCYPQGDPNGALTSGIASQVSLNPTATGFGCTEFGYNTGPGGPQAAVSPADQATFLTTGLKFMASRNAVRTYIYELFDTNAYHSTGGLFADDGTPKPAADAIAKLIAAG